MSTSEQTRRAIELYRAMTSMEEDNIFIPTGGVFLTLRRDRQQEVLTGQRSLENDDAWKIYAQWHEAVHMLQIVTTPYVHRYAYLLATQARLALEYSRAGRSEELSKIRADFQRLELKQKVKAEGYNPWEVIETHAVAQGLLWAMPYNADTLVWLANFFYTSYKPDPKYVRVINVLAEKIGEKHTIQLLPRMCWVALQTPEPALSLGRMIESVAQEQAAQMLCHCAPRQFCERFGVDPLKVSASLRERDGHLAQSGYISIFNNYFDDFEALSVDDRLDLLMGVSGGGTCYQMFTPTYSVYHDGAMELFRQFPPPLDQEVCDKWLTITSDLLDGLNKCRPDGL